MVAAMARVCCQVCYSGYCQSVMVGMKYGWKGTYHSNGIRQHRFIVCIQWWDLESHKPKAYYCPLAKWQLVHRLNTPSGTSTKNMANGSSKGAMNVVGGNEVSM